MKKILIIIFLSVCSSLIYASDSIWVKVISNDVNQVFFKFDKTYSGQQVDRSWINMKAGYFYLDGGIITMKDAAGKAIADLPEKYRKDGNGGVWEEKNQAEKDAADDAEALAKQNAKSNEQRAREAKFVNIWTNAPLNKVIPVTDVQIDDVNDKIETAIENAISAGNQATVHRIQFKATKFYSLKNQIGDDNLYDKYLGQ